ncbi:hypothetical protein ACFWN1_17950 [Streptomyces sp. NPDC058459]|uniref:hypothetical protein n=1 Tax=Streptomyces sp. NPDC058459 TaxID=3346508 RepID=UPI00365B75F3
MGQSNSTGDYEQKHTAWREARRDLDAARSKERYSVDPAVNQDRGAEQAAVRAEIRQAEQAEQTARTALRFPWER